MTYTQMAIETDNLIILLLAHNILTPLVPNLIMPFSIYLHPTAHYTMK
jgi:hypothetical protein